MKTKSNSFKKGFTLIEILVVVLLMLIMTGTLFISQKGNSAQTDADNAARKIASQLRSLQNDSLNGKKIGDDIACRAIMRLTNNSPIYRIHYYNCSNAATFGVQNIDLKNVWVKLDGPLRGEVNFSMPDGTIVPPLDNVTYAAMNKIEIVSQKSSHSTTAVCIYNSGRITEARCPGGNCDAACP